MTLSRKERAYLGRAVVYGHVAKAVELQGERVLELFLHSSRAVEVAEFTGEIYLFLLCANQLTDSLSNDKHVSLKAIKPEDLIAVNHLRNIWEHSHPSKTRLIKNWKPFNQAQEDWLNLRFPDSWPEVYSIEEADGDVKIAGILSVQLLIEEAKHWISVSKDFEGSDELIFPTTS